MKPNQQFKKILPLAAFAGLAVSANAATIAGDGVASFDLGNSVGAGGDITNNPNGLSITGQTGAWAHITTGGSGAATDDGVTLTFGSGGTPIWGNTAGDDRGIGSAGAIRLGTFLGGAVDIPWVISGLTPGASYDMIWYNKRVSPGEARHPNTGVTGFDAGNGVGASAPLDGDQDQNFIGVQADGSGNISGTWFLAGGTQDITAVTGVQIVDAIPEPSTTALLGLGGLALILRRRK